MKLLTQNPVPNLYKSQLDLFNRESMHVEDLGSFDPIETTDKLNQKDGQQVLAADFGGDKGTSLLFQVRSGEVVPTEGGYEDRVQGNDGEGYLASLKKTAQYAEENDLPMGISWGGPMKGSKVVFHPKAKLFMNELEAEFDSDLKAISPRITAAINDGPAGLISGAVQAYRHFGATNTIFIINGGGIGLAIVKDGRIYATEAGHIEGVADLNNYNQDTACGVFDAKHVCLERLGANKAGIEPQWQARTGSYMRARDIEDRYKEGDEFAGELYDHSALVIAHVLQGAAQGMDLNLNAKDTAIVAHGGAFKFPDYGQRVAQILHQHNGSQPQLIMTKDYSHKDSNACLDGAAIAAITA